MTFIIIVPVLILMFNNFIIRHSIFIYTFLQGIKSTQSDAEDLSLPQPF